MTSVPSPVGCHVCPGFGKTIAVRHDVDVVLVRKAVRSVGSAQKMNTSAIEALAIAATEVAQNILLHAREGHLCVEAFEHAKRRGISVTASDHGPGIVDFELAFKDGYSSAGGLGLGLSGARRMVDEFEIRSSPAQGTSVILRKWAS